MDLLQLWANFRRKTAAQRLPAMPSGGVTSHVSPCVLRVAPPTAAMLRWQSTMCAGDTHHAMSVMWFSTSMYLTAIDHSCRGPIKKCCEHDVSVHVAVDHCAQAVPSRVSPCVLRVVPPTAATATMQIHESCSIHKHAASVMCLATSSYQTTSDDSCGGGTASMMCLFMYTYRTAADAPW